MSDILIQPSSVVRTERGLSIAGTRTTLYSIMDYLKADWPPSLIQHWFNLTDTQMADVLTYIDSHRSEVEAEYETVLQQAEDIRTYWDTRNRDLRKRIAELPPKPGQEALYAKLKARKTELGME